MGDALEVWRIDSCQLGVDDEDRTRSFFAAEAVELIEKACHTLTANEARLREGLLVAATRVEVNEDLYAIYAQIGPPQWRELARLMRQFDNATQMKDAAKVNLIPFNPFPGTRFERSPEDDIRAFQKLLQDARVLTTVRRTRGDDIDAACGQLKGQVMDRTRRSERYIAVRELSAEADQALAATKPI
jgi:hypothetical protein